mmetsp:Transcript_24778/g.57205  ORF Transcript_24778/g.57205 Transcript_24778/m.57205 type:complete len:115 (+) Transcript_24778:30-374(+)
MLREHYAPIWFWYGSSELPTTGMLGMLVCLSFCKEVIAYGMAETPRAWLSAHHWYQNPSHWYVNPNVPKEPFDARNFHNSFSAEKDLWRRLAVDLQELDRTEVVTLPGFSQLHC